MVVFLLALDEDRHFYWNNLAINERKESLCLERKRKLAKKSEF